MPKRGSKRKKSKTHQEDAPEGANIGGEGAAKADTPRSLVVRSSKVVSNVQDLILEMRKVMSPHTATNLREKRFNRVKDYVTVAGQLAITHLLAFSQTESSLVMKIARFPNGPTLHLKVKNYCLCRHVRASQRRPFESPLLYNYSPLVVLHNFSQSDESHVKLMRTTFQHMFPSISVKTVKLPECRRVVLFHYHPEDGTVEMRHYAVRATPTGINKSIKKLLEAKIPDLGRMDDVSEFVDGTDMNSAASDSEGEDDNSKVSLPDRFVGRGNAQSQQASIKLTELGPRLTLELFKVERNVCEGEVIYHKYLHKSAEEAGAQQTRIDKERALKQQRRMQQEDNVKRKRELLEAKKEEQVNKRTKRDSTSFNPTTSDDSDKKGAKHGRDDESDVDEYDDDGDDEGTFDEGDDEDDDEE